MYRKFVLLVLVSVLLFSAVPRTWLVERGVDVANPRDSGQRVMSGLGVNGFSAMGHSMSEAPRVDELLIKIYPNQTAEFMALNASEIDIVDSPLTAEWVDALKANPDVTLANYSDLGMFEFDINNQQWPTNNTDFRRALAHLVDKDGIITDVLGGYGVRIDTPIPRPLLETYYNSEARVYEYNTTKAAEILDALGFVIGPDNMTRIDPNTGDYLAPLMFYARIDDHSRTEAGQMLAEEMTNIGIPVTLNITEKNQCFQKVMVEYDYHLYTGGWGLGRDVNYLYYLYHSNMYWAPDPWSRNYPGFCNETYDYWAEKLQYTTNETEVLEAAFECQEILADQAAIIPLWCPTGKKVYGTAWEGVVNEMGRGVDSWWTFLNATKDATIRWGFQKDIRSLNPVYAGWYWDWNVLNEIYDTLLKYNPYNLTEDIPWMAESYEVGTWFNPDTNTTCTKLTFQLLTDIYFHDDVQCMAEDVKFTIDYLKQFPNAWPYSHVEDVHHVDTPDPFTVVVYENITSCWSLHQIGGLPILPRHVWEDIEDPGGFAPDPNLIGTGPFKFVEYYPGDHILLRANPNYLKQIEVSEPFGPRVDELLIKIFPDPETEFMALNASEIDIVDSPLTAEWIERFEVNPDVVLASYLDLGMWEFDINNQRWPTNNTDFRRALAHLVDKDRIITEAFEGYGWRIDTPIPAARREYINPAARVYEYNATKAAEILDAAGFVIGPNGKTRVDPLTGDYLAPLKFYARLDDPSRMIAGQIFTEEMAKIGIPVDLHVWMKWDCFVKVMLEFDYHLYTGGWHLGRDVDYLYDLYHSSMYAGPGPITWDEWLPNYPGFINATYDHWAEKLKCATNRTEVLEAAFKCQEIFADQVGVIPLLSSLDVKAYRTGWEGVVNTHGYGVDSWWTFLNAHPEGVATGGTIRWGFRRDIESLNPVYAEWFCDWNVLWEIYDSLLAVNPYNLTDDLLWMAESYEVGTWHNPETDTDCTKLTFQLPTDIYFHDDVQCTAEDVKFTIDYIKHFPNSSLYWSVMDVHHVDTPSPFTVVVYENITSYWTLHGIGGLPILPRHVWEDIEDPTGFAPDPYLVGTGPFKFVEYYPGDHILLQRNPEYRTRTYVHDVAVVNVTLSAPEVYVGQMINITVVVRNEGTANETFTVTAYYDNTIIGTQVVTDLIPGTKSLTFSWDTTGVTLGDYTMKAEAGVVAGETDTADNILVDGTVRVKMVKIVEVIPCDQVGDPRYTFGAGTMAYFKVTINNTAVASADMLLTVNAYDSDGTTIGVTSFQGSITPGISVFILGLPIPTSANAGTATVYANAFTDWPHLGGIPHCPETSETFEITGP